MAEHLTLQELRRRTSIPALIAADPFTILKALCGYISDPETEPRAHELVLRALEHRSAFGRMSLMLDGLVRQVGLFPYLEEEDLGLADAIAYEYHRPLNMEPDGLVFHRVQAQVYEHLMSGDNVVLSAPTSFGKSLIIDAVVASGKFRNIAIIVPTIALIDETRRRLSRFSDRFKIITHSGQQRSGRNLIVMTQERFLEQESPGPVDFFVIDEFYKLQPREEDQDRSYLLNEAFYRLFKTGAQFYLLGPNIQSLSSEMPQRLDFRFIKTDYKTVASEVYTVKPSGDDLAALVRLCSTLTEPTLIYCRSPARVKTVIKRLLEADICKPENSLDHAVSWIGEQYDPAWVFPKALHRGIGMHHGKLPRALAQYVVKAFNEDLVRFLVCTSTLIEGVNTKAKNVIIFDNTVARRKFDFFTYNNILGRSGRMFHHFVGHVYVFHAPPAEELPIVDFPAFTQPASTPDTLLVQLDESDLMPSARQRVNVLKEQEELELDTLRASKGVDPIAQIRLAAHIRENAYAYYNQLRWTGIPNWEELKLACALIWDYLVTRTNMRAGVSSAAQLAFRINRFRQSGGPSELIREELRTRGERSADDVVDEIIEWLRTWASFEFPKYLRALDRIQRAVLTRIVGRAGNYGLFSTSLENWFLDPAIMALDEYGIPVQIGQKLESALRPNGNLDIALQRLKVLSADGMPLSPFERELIEDAKRHL